MRSALVSATVPRRARRWLGAWGLLVALVAQAQTEAPSGPTYADVAPIFAKHCVLCHAGPSPAAGLRLDALESLLKGSAKGPVVQAGQPAASELVRRIQGSSLPRMPMTGPPFLDAADTATIERWIAGGLQAGSAVATAAQPAPVPTRPVPGEAVTYLHVAPILATRCAKCHTDNGLMGPPPEGYRLTSHAATVSPADRVRVVPGHPAASELMRRVRGQAHPRMPLDGPPYLAPDEVQLLDDWIAQGARNSEGVRTPLPVGAELRLHGRLDATGRLDGLELLMGPRTRTDGRPGPGAYVQVRGRLDASGRVLVERLRSR